MKPRVLFLTCTRDGYSNPSRRLPDKHTRLFHGKTLDEWFCIRAWSSRTMTDFALVGETPEHCDRIRPIVEKYGGEVLCRPEPYLHPKEDTGGQPLRWGMRDMVARHGPYNAIMQNFVVNPVIPPGMFDEAVDRFFELCMDSEMYEEPPILEPLCYAIECYKEQRANGRTYMMGPLTNNTGKVTNRWKGTIGWNVTTQDVNEWAWLHTQSGLIMKLSGLLDTGTYPFKVPVWTDVHIDTQEDWDLAEWYFGKYIGEGEMGYNRYVEYRKSWEATC